MSSPPSLGARPRVRRSWGQRLIAGFAGVVAVACAGSAVGLWYGAGKVSQIGRVSIAPGVLEPSGSSGGGDAGAIDSGGPLPPENWLLTGSDSRACIDPSSPYAGAFLGDGQDIGQRSDTIMVLRVDPDSSFAAILSFPRDLYVKVPGSTRKQKINAAFTPGRPDKLIETIQSNFGVPINHYVDVSFCAFKSVVDAVGGVRVPFAYDTRDKHTGLNAAAGECKQLSGEAALAYARSRYYEAKINGRWVSDGTSDWGRIKRQQYLIQRVLQAAIDRGARNPATLTRLLDAITKNLTIDDTVPAKDLTRLALRLRTLDPSKVKTYTIQGRNTKVNGLSVVQPLPDDPINRAVVRIFNGSALPADLSTADGASGGDGVTGTVPTVPASGSTAAPVTASTNAAPTTTIASAFPTLPSVSVPDDPYDGSKFLPPDDPTCV